MKKILIYFCLLSVLFCCVFLSSCSDVVTEKDFQYKVTDKEVAEVVKYTGDKEIVKIPEKFGKSVSVSLSSKTFTSAKNVKEVYIPATVSKIEENPFRDCISLKKIVVDEKNTHYMSKDGCLYDKTGKTLIACPVFADLKVLDLEGVSNVLDYAAEKNLLIESINIPSTVKKIGKYAFSSMNSLKSVSFDEGVEEVGEFAFSNNEKLDSIKIPATLKNSGVGIFENCLSLTEAKFEGEDIVIPDRAFFNCKKLALLPSGDIIKIGTAAFKNCDSIENISIPVSVTDIGDYAFDGCDNLKSLDMGKALVGEYAFANCTSLVDVKVNTANGVVPKYAFYSCTSLENVSFSENIYEIQSYSFAYCKMKNIVIPDGVTTLGGSVFLGCKSLLNVSMTDSVSSVGTYVFYDCASLKTVVLSENITKIPEYFFCHCLNLTDVNIPSKLESIGKYAFFCCRRLKDIVFTDKITSLGEYSFAYCDSFFEVKLPSSLKTIKKEAFANSKGISKITIPSNVSTLGADIFKGSASLQTVYVKKDSEADKWLKKNKGTFSVEYN